MAKWGAKEKPDPFMPQSDMYSLSKDEGNLLCTRSNAKAQPSERQYGGRALESCGHGQCLSLNWPFLSWFPGTR